MTSPDLKSASADRELVLTRLIKAPRALVFEAWTDPDRVAQWWGPRGFTTTTFRMDFQVGGVWRFIMHGPDGVDYPNRIVYTEIVRPERIGYDHGDDVEGAGAGFKVVVTFEDQGGQTALTLRMICDSVEQLEGMKKFGAVEGGTQTLDRLEEYLADVAGAVTD
jgi:uncharacterized protein YndB with AHSA1/START domain